ncbi:MAG: pentapeptide repeat-containing protein [Chloroflexi bacterium]|nr:pentapeptide repeat-containing protein [Chloroflexota bacterium]
MRAQERKAERKNWVDLPKRLEAVEGLTLESDGDYEGLRIVGCKPAAPAIGSVKVRASVVKGGHFAEARINGLKALDVRFEECDFANATLMGAVIERVEFVKCRMTGFKAPEAVVKQVAFVDCTLKLSALRLARLDDVQFERCVLSEADFYGSRLSNVEFTSCELVKAEFSASKLLATDFRTSNIAGLHIGLDSLKGAIIDPTQVSDLAWLLGARIEFKE